MIPSMIDIIDNPRIEPQEKIRQLTNMKTEAIYTIDTVIKQIVSPDQEIPDKVLADHEIDALTKSIFD